MRTLHAWHLFWLAWFLVSFFTFLGFEIYALCTDWQRTLSAAVWYFESEHPGTDQPLWSWTAAHVLFAGFWIVVFGWLTAHFIWGRWT